MTVMAAYDLAHRGKIEAIEVQGYIVIDFSKCTCVISPCPKVWACIGYYFGKPRAFGEGFASDGGNLDIFRSIQLKDR